MCLTAAAARAEHALGEGGLHLVRQLARLELRGSAVEQQTMRTRHEHGVDPIAQGGQQLLDARSPPCSRSGRHHRTPPIAPRRSPRCGSCRSKKGAIQHRLGIDVQLRNSDSRTRSAGRPHPPDPLVRPCRQKFRLAERFDDIEHIGQSRWASAHAPRSRTPGLCTDCRLQPPAVVEAPFGARHVPCERSRNLARFPSQP